MSVRSLGFTVRGGYAGVYQFPSINISPGLEIIQIRDNIVKTDEELQVDIDNTNAKITYLNTLIQELNTNTQTLLNNIIDLQNEVNDRLSQVDIYSQTIDATNLLISAISADTSSPYNTTIPIYLATTQNFTFTPNASTVNQIYNVPTTFYIFYPPTSAYDVLYNMNFNLQFIGNDVLNYQNIANGSIAYLYVSNQKKMLYTCQIGSGCFYFPNKQIEDINNCQFNIAHSDIINVPYNTDYLFFGILISTHYSNNMDANAFSQISFILNQQTVPMISITKI